ncbi:hypothetical protein [Flavobacterium sp.]|uniref:hypothetical protein n=1 Tax=Flavobacterium sp. TaxID=239 RepID=UPI00263276DA|nr:hypothetical protein [Flavobacterium sp.]
MKEFKKLSKEELKTITANGVCVSCSNGSGGNNNPPPIGNDWQKICGAEPPICASNAWLTWKACLNRNYLAGPEPTCT